MFLRKMEPALNTLVNCEYVPPLLAHVSLL